MIIRKRIYIVDDNLINIMSVNLLVQNMNHIYLSYPETESIIVCPVGHPLISTLCLWEREICNFSRWKEKLLYEIKRHK